MSDGSFERPTDSILRITKDEALSEHVDDLLKRQASLRGERGISANRRRRWYYSNCFVFAIAGFFGAIVAASLLEPHFHDTLPYRGTVTRIEPMPDGLGYLPLDDGQSLSLLAGAHAVGSVTVGGDELWFTDLTREFTADGTSIPFEFDSLEVGTDALFYVEYFAEEGIGVGLVRYVDLAPSGNVPVGQSLRQLDAAQHAVGLLLFPVVAALIGLAIGAIDGMVCRLWRRVFVAGVVGLLIGFLGGFVSQFLAGIVYLPLNNLAMEQQTEGLGHLTTLGFLTQVTGRGLAWCLAGMAMGLGQGVAMRSGRLLLYGFLGGAIGGLVGGLLFDPIDLLLLGTDKPSAHLSRFIGLATIGIVVGAMIGIVELLARDAWLQMIQGPLAGKEFLVFKDSIQIGASPRSDIYLFNDSDVAPRHATIRAAADHYELEATDRQQHPVLVNGRPIQRTRLRHGDQITLGRTVFAFQKRRKD